MLRVTLPPQHADLRSRTREAGLAPRTRDRLEMIRLAGALGWFWFVRGHLRDARFWLNRAIARGDAESTSLRIQTAIVYGVVQLLVDGQPREAEHVVAGGLALARDAGDVMGVVQALTVLGVSASAQGDYDRATASLEEAVTLARTLEEPRQAVALANLGDALRGLGRIAGAAAHHEEALAGQRAVGSVRGEMNSLADQGEVAHELGDQTTAVARLRAALRLAWDFGEQRTIAITLEGIACMAAALGQAANAARLFGAAERLREVTGIGVFLPLNRAANEQGVTTARTALGETEFSATWAAGRALSIEPAVVEALDPAQIPAGSPPAERTPRQLEILRLLATGQTDGQIAAALFVSVRTVENHVYRIFAKLGVQTRTAATAGAFAGGLIDPPAPASD